MKVLVALALLWLGTDAFYSKYQKLREPPFLPGRSHHYELTVNFTAGVPGLSNQVAKSVLKLDVVIKAKSYTEYILKIENVRLSEPRKSVEDDEESIPYRRASEFEAELAKPVKYFYRKGEVVSYSLSEDESEESKNLKKSILRHFQLKLNKLFRSSTTTPSEENEEYRGDYPPVTYEVVENGDYRPYLVHYLVTSSPYPEFPEDEKVYNISKTWIFDKLPSVHEHHNFAAQGCESVWRRVEHHRYYYSRYNPYAAGWPYRYEHHHVPLKHSRTAHYNLKEVEGKPVIEEIYAEEKDVANTYDQDMQVTTRYYYELKAIRNRELPEPREEASYSDLSIYPPSEERSRSPSYRRKDDDSSRYEEEEESLHRIFGSSRLSDIVAVAERLLEDVTEEVVRADTEQTVLVGEKVIQLQRALSVLKKTHYDILGRKIVDYTRVQKAPEKEKVKRQLFLDFLPLAGSDDSLKYIKYLIKSRKLSSYEAKEVLEAIPENLVDPDYENVKDLYEIVELPFVKRYHVLHSAAYLTLSKVIHKVYVSPAFYYYQEYRREYPQYEEAYRQSYGHPRKYSGDDHHDSHWYPEGYDEDRREEYDSQRYPEDVDTQQYRRRYPAEYDEDQKQEYDSRRYPEEDEKQKYDSRRYPEEYDEDKKEEYDSRRYPEEYDDDKKQKYDSRRYPEHSQQEYNRRRYPAEYDEDKKQEYDSRKYPEDVDAQQRYDRRRYPEEHDEEKREEYDSERYPEDEAAKSSYNRRRYYGKYVGGRKQKYTPREYSEDETEQERFYRHRYPEEYEEDERYRFYYASKGKEESRSSSSYHPSAYLTKYIRELHNKLKESRKLQEKVVYIQALAHVSYYKVLRYLAPYIEGTAEDLERYSPSDVDYLKTITIFALHQVVSHYPEIVQRYVSPLYFNRTESSAIRMAAFSLLIRTNPSLSLLQRIATDSYLEPSREVGSYVYSTLQSYGNSTDPCMKMTADRIKHIISQVRDYDIGAQYSKNIIKTYFDELRNFGLYGRFSVVYSNESSIPRSLYTGASYNVDSLRDIALQAAIHVKGLEVSDLLKYVDPEIFHYLGVNYVAPNIDERVTRDLNFVPRLPSELRVAFYRRFFYTSSYHLFDAETIVNYLRPIKEHFQKYFTVDRQTIKGHYVKLYIPSSYHAIVYTGIGLPVEFNMRHPVIFSLKVEARRPSEDHRSISYYIRPSVYYTSYVSNAIINKYDRHVYGSYRYQTYHLSVPVELDVTFRRDQGAFEISFKLPRLPKQVYSHHSEAGTYAREAKLVEYPGHAYLQSREPIRTQPALFQYEKTYHPLPFLPLYFVRHSENIQDDVGEIPRSFEEFMQVAVEEVRNSGWRYRDVNATLVRSQRAPVEKVTFRFSYRKSHDVRHPLRSYERQYDEQREGDESEQRGEYHQRSGDDESEQRGEYHQRSGDDEYEQRDEYHQRSGDDEYEQRGEHHQRSDNEHEQRREHQQGSDDEHQSGEEYVQSPFERKLTESRRDEEDQPEFDLNDDDARREYEYVVHEAAKVKHEFKVEVETTPNSGRAQLRVEYNQTYDKLGHSVFVHGKVEGAAFRSPYQVCVSHVMRYPKVPSEFYYDYQTYQRHRAIFYSAINFEDECTTAFSDSYIKAYGAVYKVPYEHLFDEADLASAPRTEDYYPEGHEECEEDKREGKSQSEACQSAAVEESYYNRFLLKVVYKEELPPVVRNFTYKVEEAFKAAYYGYVESNSVDVRNEPKTVRFIVDYVQKLTDEPVASFYIEKPEENIYFRRVSAGAIYPPSSILTYHESHLYDVTKGKYPVECSLMENYVRTYDDETYEMPEDSCQYVLSMHCAERKTFIVLAKKISEEEKTKEVTIYVKDYAIVLKPRESSGYYVIEFNHRPYEVKRDRPVFFDERYPFYAYVIPTRGSHQPDILVVEAEHVGLKVKYDGRNAKVQVHPTYKGHLCGLCSEFDGEVTQEFVGPDDCLYQDSEDFAHSYVVNKAECRADTRPKHAYICASGESHYPEGHHYSEEPETFEPESFEPEITHQGYEADQVTGVKERNIHIQRGEFICFSNHPQPVCAEDEEEVDRELRTVDFHCLPKYDSTTRRLMLESRERVLRKLASKSVDVSQSVHVAKSCSPRN